MYRPSQILNELRLLVRRIFPNSEGSVYLYGSRARGDNSKYSDWDLLIIADHEESKESAFERLAFPFAELGWRFDEQITPLLYSKKEWYDERNTLFYHNVISEAIKL